MAAAHGKTGTAELLPDKGADATLATPDNNWTILHAAARNGNVKVVELLIVHGADVNAKDKYDWTPLNLALKYKRSEVVSVLKEHGAKE